VAFRSRFGEFLDYDWAYLDDLLIRLTTTLVMSMDHIPHIIMDKATKSNKLTAQGVSEPPGLVGISSGLPGSTPRSSGYWRNGGER
jgi:hypothetical protein